MSGAIDSVQMPFGLRDGKLLHISEVSNGLDCGCVCAGCKAQLVARKGKIKQHHFAHAANSDCVTGYETALHLAAKDIIDRRKEILLPPVKVFSRSHEYLEEFSDVSFPATWHEYYDYSEIAIADEKRYQIDTVLLETRLGRIIPDVIAYISETPLIIEIKVTHGVHNAKLRQIKKLKTSAIEIDLSKLPRDIDIPLLESLIVDSSDQKSWIYNRTARRKAAELQRSAYYEIKNRRRQEQERERVQAARQKKVEELRDSAHSQIRSLPIISDAKAQRYITAGCPVSLHLYKFYHAPFLACAVHAKDTETVLPDFAANAQEIIMSGCSSHTDCEYCPYYRGREQQFIQCAGMSDYAIARLRAGAWRNYDGTTCDVSLLPNSKIVQILRYLAKRGQSVDNSAWAKAFVLELESRNQGGSLPDNQLVLQSA